MVSYVLLLGALVLYWTAVAVYRLYFSPLAKFPGPKLAALTTWYCMYHDMIRGGQYTFVVEQMHREYGPIVRIMPDVLHVNDPNFVDQIYPAQSSAHRRDRAWTVLNFFQANYSSLSTGPHDLHRNRRAVMSRFFSKQNVRRLVPVINETLADLLRRIEGFARTGDPVVINAAFKAATKDVIQFYALGDGRKCLDMEDFNANFFATISPKRLTHSGVHFHFLLAGLNKMPPSLFRALSPHVANFIGFLDGIAVQIEEVRNAKVDPEGRTIFHEVINSDLPESEKTTPLLVDEAMVLCIAGADTTASTLSALTCHILSDRAMFTRLRAELESVMKDPNQAPDPARLDSLPYLNALIEEAIRFYPSATHRQDRIATDEDLPYHYPDGSGRSIVVPKGTPIGMSARILNRHPAWYGGDADEFRPERYLEDPRLMHRHLTFSKGGRQCLGMNLAYQELQTFTAGIFRKFSLYDCGARVQNGPTLELYQTTLDDIRIAADYVTPGHPVGSQGVRVRVRMA